MGGNLIPWPGANSNPIPGRAAYGISDCRAANGPVRFRAPDRPSSHFFCSTRTQSTSACTPPAATLSTLDCGRPQYGVVTWFQPAG